MLLYSDMGRVLFSITEDTCGLHDTLGGCSNLRRTQVSRRRSNSQVERETSRTRVITSCWR
jgi:uncharacterized protein YcgI (DUF1989 family)